MHKNTVDWFRQLHLTPDAPLAAKRWAAAEGVAKSLSRRRIIELLRLFLFPTVAGKFTEEFTDELVKLDPEFPTSENIEELRLVAGVVMVASFGKSTDAADSFALGIRAARLPDNRLQPAQPAILAEADRYLREETARLRASDYGDDLSDVTKGLVGRGKALAEAEQAADEAKLASALTAYRKSVVETITNSHGRLAGRVERLAEECGFLWWVLGEYSDTLDRPVNEMSADAYALAAAAEAAQRTLLLPPPPSVGPLLARALRSCKSKKKKFTLVDYVAATEPAWRATQLNSLIISDCHDLVPISTTIEKTEELGDPAAASDLLKKLCPGVAGDLALEPAAAALQFYNELLFVQSLKEADGN